MKQDVLDRVLEQWGQERPDLDLRAMGVIGRVLRLSRVLESRINEVLVQEGVEGWAFDVLATLRRAGAPYTLTPTVLFSTLLVSSGAMTHRVNQLEKLGLVERARHPTDGRGVSVRLTDAGVELVDRVIVRHAENEQQLMQVLADDEQAMLARLLRKLSLHFDKPAPPRSRAGRGKRKARAADPCSSGNGKRGAEESDVPSEAESESESEAEAAVAHGA